VPHCTNRKGHAFGAANRSLHFYVTAVGEKQTDRRGSFTSDATASP